MNDREKRLAECLANIQPPQQEYNDLATQLEASGLREGTDMVAVLADYFQIFGNGYDLWQQVYDYPRVHEYFYVAYLSAKERLRMVKEYRAADKDNVADMLFNLSLAIYHNVFCENALVCSYHNSLFDNASKALEYAEAALAKLAEIPDSVIDPLIKTAISDYISMNRNLYVGLVNCASLYLIPWGDPERLAKKAETIGNIERVFKAIQVQSRELYSELRAHYFHALRLAEAYEQRKKVNLRVKQADVMLRATAFVDRKIAQAIFEESKKEGGSERLMTQIRETSELTVTSIQNARYLNDAFETRIGIETLDGLRMSITAGEKSIPAGKIGLTITLYDGEREVIYEADYLRINMTRNGSVALEMGFTLDADVSGATYSVSHMRIVELMIGPHMGRVELVWKSAPSEKDASKPFVKPEATNFVQNILRFNKWLEDANEYDLIPESEFDVLDRLREKRKVWERRFRELTDKERITSPTRGKVYNIEKDLVSFQQNHLDLQEAYNDMRQVVLDWKWVKNTEDEADSESRKKFKSEARRLFPPGRTYLQLTDVCEEILRRFGFFLHDFASKRDELKDLAGEISPLWTNPHNCWQGIVLCNQLVLRDQNDPTKNDKGQWVFTEREPADANDVFDVINHPEFKGFAIQAREARAAIDDWMFVEKSPNLQNLALLRSHNTDVVYVGQNRAFVYMPDDPQFIINQYLINSRLVGDLRTIVLAYYSRAKDLVRKADEALKQVQQNVDKEHDLNLSIRNELVQLTQEIHSVLRLVRDSSMTKYEDHGELIRAMIHASQIGVVEQNLRETLAYMQQQFSYLQAYC